MNPFDIATHALAILMVLMWIAMMVALVVKSVHEWQHRLVEAAEEAGDMVIERFKVTTTLGVTTTKRNDTYVEPPSEITRLYGRDPAPEITVTEDTPMYGEFEQVTTSTTPYPTTMPVQPVRRLSEDVVVISSRKRSTKRIVDERKKN